MKKSTSGFTLIELIVVIIVIVILAAIGTMAYAHFQAQSSDSKRQSDMAILQSELEKYYNKNGEYPGGCTKVDSAHPTSCSMGSAPILNTSSKIFNNTTITQLRSIFPDITSSFGDPDGNSDLPFGSPTVGYIYAGQFEIGGGGTGSSIGLYTIITNSCGTTSATQLQGYISSASPSSYLIGYKSPADNKWHLYQGNHGSRVSTSSFPVHYPRNETIGNCVLEN